MKYINVRYIRNAIIHEDSSIPETIDTKHIIYFLTLNNKTFLFEYPAQVPLALITW